MSLKNNYISVKVNGFSAQAKPLSVLRPGWADMQKNYPNHSVTPIHIYTDIGRGLVKLLKDDPDQWENTCAFRMSRGLNYSGVKLPYNNTKYRAKGSTGGVHVGEDKRNYWYRVSELKPWLIDNLGKPDVVESGGFGIVEKFKNKKGIIAFDVAGWKGATGHFTLWDGKDLSYFGMDEPERNDPNDKENYYFNINYRVRNGDGTFAFHDNGTPWWVKTTKVRLWELK